MFNYTVYPYTSNSEYLKDCFSWLDLFFNRLGSDVTPPIVAIQSARESILSRERVTTGNAESIPLLALSSRCQMDDLTFFLLLLALAPEYNLRYETVYAELQGNPDCLSPTLGLAKSLYPLYDASYDLNSYYLSDPEHYLNRYLLVKTEPEPPGSLSHRILKLKKQAALFLLGDQSLPEFWFGICQKLPPFSSAFICLPEQRQLLLSACDMKNTDAPCSLPVKLIGAEGTGRKFLLSLLSKEKQIPVFSTDMRSIYQLETADFTTFLESLAAQAWLLQAAIHLDHAESTEKQDILRRSQLLSTLTHCCSLLFISLEQECSLSFVLPAISIQFPIPPASKRLLAWEYFGASYQLDHSHIRSFAVRYHLSPGVIQKVIAEAHLSSSQMGLRSIGSQQLISAISHNQSLGFDGLATRIRTIYTWNDLMVSDKQEQLLKLACNRLKLKDKVMENWGLGQRLSYGRGLSLLLTGPPGTGKTMAAQVIAKDTGMDLYRVDLSQISSKYIGETEKNINKVFNEAAKADIILLFDEADSLFGKRTNIDNSNDKHANAETACILQQIEEYDGMVILSTNLYQNIDSAFLRRITYTVRFDLPDEATRFKLWTSLLPPQAPLSPQIDFQFFSRKFELSGSAIKSILYSAAYLAAAQGDEILPKHIVQAMKYEFIKLGKIISDNEFDQYSIYL